MRPEGVAGDATAQRGTGARPADDLAWPLDGTRPERVARRVVTSVLAGLGIDAGRCDDAELAIQELVANARLHAPGPYELRVRVSGTAVTLSVADGGGDHAVIGYLLDSRLAPAVPPSAECGRGLQIVSALFPGACGAGPARATLGGAAKQVWICVARGDGGASA